MKYKECYIKQIREDGNYYYRCLSYYFRNKEYDHLEFRELISEIFEKNIDMFKEDYPDPDIIGEKKPETKTELTNLYLSQ